MLLSFGAFATAGEINSIAVHHRLAHARAGLVTFDAHLLLRFSAPFLSGPAGFGNLCPRTRFIRGTIA
jgi:hypothetical protein